MAQPCTAYFNKGGTHLTALTHQQEVVQDIVIVQQHCSVATPTFDPKMKV